MQRDLEELAQWGGVDGLYFAALLVTRGLRNYGLPPLVWGGAEGCDHEWGEWTEKHDERESTKTGKTRTTDRHYGAESRRFNGNHQKHTSGQHCLHCHAWRGSLGLEPMPALYVAHLVEVMREVKRVLRDDGILVVNLGDSYASSGTFGHQNMDKLGERLGCGGGHKISEHPSGRAPTPPGLKPKDLCGIPWRVAFALQADGWYLRSAMPWVKKNPMPESVTDRPTTAHEYVFLLAKRKRYYWDADAVRVGATYGENRATFRGGGAYTNNQSFHNSAQVQGDGETRPRPETTGRNRRTSDTFYESLDLRIQQQREYLAHLEYVRANGGMLLGETGDPVALMVNTKGFPGSHFAVFPPALVEPCIKAGSSQKGVCPECGAGWKRCVERTSNRNDALKWDTAKRHDGAHGAGYGDISNTNGQTLRTTYTTTGWRPGCECGTVATDLPVLNGVIPYEPHVPIPATCLDPFGGSGTVGLVAEQLGRDSILCELNADYAQMARERIDGAPVVECVVDGVSVEMEQARMFGAVEVVT